MRFALRIISLIISIRLYSGLLPDYDERCDAMRCHHAEIDTLKNPSHKNYFSKKAPKIIHQIWFGDRARMDHKKTQEWQNYANQFEYTYFLWTEKSDETVKSFMNPKNYDLMLSFRAQGNFWSASDILRYELINYFGGVYVDVDFMPPRADDDFVDLEEIVNFNGLTLMTENIGRNIGGTALFAANGFIICPPNHPVICSLVEQVYENATHWHRAMKECWPMFETGPFLLNRVLWGCFNIVPCHYLKQYKMYDWDW